MFIHIPKRSKVQRISASLTVPY